MGRFKFSKAEKIKVGNDMCLVLKLHNFTFISFDSLITNKGNIQGCLILAMHSL